MSLESSKILVVDDEVDLVQMLRTILEKSEYKVATALDGMNAVVLAQSYRPDLILLDIMMHEIDGWEVLKLLRMDPRTQRIPVVILSARSHPRDRIRALQEGAQDYLSKPFSIQDLLDTIGGLVEKPDEHVLEN